VCAATLTRTPRGAYTWPTADKWSSHARSHPNALGFPVQLGRVCVLASHQKCSQTLLTYERYWCAVGFHAPHTCTRRSGFATTLIEASGFVEDGSETLYDIVERKESGCFSVCEPLRLLHTALVHHIGRRETFGPSYLHVCFMYYLRASLVYTKSQTP